MTGKRKFSHGLPVISLTEINRPATARVAHDIQIVNATPSNVKTASQTSNDDVVTNRPWLAARRDAPVCNFSRRAKRLTDVHWGRGQRDAALELLRRDYTSSSAKGPAASVLKTWEIMRKRMHDPGTPTYPLTPEKIARVAAAFKSCGYRSFSNYMSKAKERHIDMVGAWGVDLNMDARRSCRSVTGGIGRGLPWRSKP